MAEKENSIEELTIPSVNEETSKAGAIQRWVILGGIAFVLIAAAGGVFWAKSAMGGWWASVTKPAASKADNTSSGVDASAKSVDLQAAINGAKASDGGLSAPGAATSASGAAGLSAGTPPASARPGQQPGAAAPAGKGGAAQAGARADASKQDTAGCVKNVTMDANGNPVVICADNGQAVKNRQVYGANAPGATAAVDLTPRVSRLDAMLATAPVEQRGAAGNANAAQAALMAAQALSGGGATQPAPGQQMQPIDPQKAVQSYLATLGHSGAVPGGAGPAPQAAAPAALAAPQGGGGALANEFQATKLSGVRAAKLGDLNLTWPRGAGADCVLDGAIDASTSGYVSCTLSEPMYSANGRVVLAEKGSSAMLEYHAVAAQGQTTFPLIAGRITTANGVVAELDSGAQGPLGQTGATGAIDNRWGERLGAAMIVAMIGDATSYEIAKASSGSNGQVSPYQQSQGIAQSIPSQVLATTINIKPKLLKNQGETIRIVAARDVDFSSVYRLVNK